LRIARTCVRALLISIACVGVVAPATMSTAAPSASDLQQQIDEKSKSLEAITEQYNRVTEELKNTAAQQAALAATLAPLQAKMDDAYGSVQSVAVKAYEGVPMSKTAALLRAGSPADLLEQLGELDRIGRQHHSEIAGYEKAKSAYDAQKRQLDAAQATQTAEQQQLDGQKTKINTELQALYGLRTQAYGQPTETPKKSTAAAPAVSGAAGVAVRFAYNALGTPYVWAGESSSGYDCSGLTKAAWGAAGYSLPHNAAMQWNSVAHISRANLAAGDLVFYSGLGHVGIYVGNNQIAHAPHAGTVVQLANINIESIYGYGRVH